jgi:hypothetical protein
MGEVSENRTHIFAVLLFMDCLTHSKIQCSEDTNSHPETYIIIVLLMEEEGTLHSLPELNTRNCPEKK